MMTQEEDDHSRGEFQGVDTGGLQGNQKTSLHKNVQITFQFISPFTLQLLYMTITNYKDNQCQYTHVILILSVNIAP